MLHLLPRIPWLFIHTAALKKVRALAGGIACFDRELPVGRLLMFVAVCEGGYPVSCCGLQQSKEFSSETSIQVKLGFLTFPQKRTSGKASMKESWGEDDIST